MPVYAHAKVFAAALDDFVEAFPGYRGYLRDQLRRAALSILLNLAEGATETEPKEKARMYRLARRSAAECGAALDLTATLIPVLAERAAALDRRVADLATEIHRLILSQRRRSKAPGRTPKRRAE